MNFPFARLVALLVLVGTLPLRAGLATLPGVAVVQQTGSRAQRINMVFLSEGYTSSQMTKYANDVSSVVNYVFGREPWVRYQSYCNVYRIEVASNQSGTDNGSDNTGARDTYFSTGFYNPGILQSIVIGSAGSTRAYSLLNTYVPEYDIAVVLVNDSKYGGSGGPLAVVTTNSLSPQILEHELGHSFAKLTDEYDEEYKGYPNIEYPNATAKTVRSQIRWNVWIDPTTNVPTSEGNFFSGYSLLVGLYEGANYHKAGWYRPHDNALMRNLGREVGNVTREAIILSYYGRVAMIEGATPSTAPQTITTQVPLSFSLTLKTPSTGPALTTQWLIDNVPQAATSSTLSIPSKSIGNGTHTVKAIVRDPTDWVRRDPSGLMVEEKSWTLRLSNQTDPPVLNTPLPARRVLALGSVFSLDATATGTSPIIYQWLKNNVPANPAVTTPTLNVGPVTLASAGTYTAKLTNPGYVRPFSCALAVLDPVMPQVVVGNGRTATLAFNASANLPPVTWFTNSNRLDNGSHYANATTRALQVKGVTTADTGLYTFTTGDYGPAASVRLQVVTDKPDYTGQTPTLPAGIVGAVYSQAFPLPTNLLRLPNSFSALGLPKGLSINAKTGAISGIPTVASIDKVLGDEVAFTVGNEFGNVPLKIRMLIQPLPPGVEGGFSGPVYVSSSLGSVTGGIMNVTVASTGFFTGSAIIGTETLPFSGNLQTSGLPATYILGGFYLKPKHLSSPLRIVFSITDYGDNDPATASLSDGGVNFTLWRNKWVPPEATHPFAGYHTFYLPPSTNANAPKGYGFGSVTIDANGKTILTGKLADGSSFATSSLLTPDGSVFAYQGLYATTVKGSFIAFLDMEPGPPAYFSASNSLSLWSRPADTRAATLARAFKSGFGPESPLPVGGLYARPATTAIPMGLNAGTGTPPANASLTFQQLLGDDPLGVNPNVTLNLKAGSSVTVNTPNPKATTFGITPADGRFAGSYTTTDADPRGAPRPAIKRVVPYQGIIVPVSGGLKGFGYHLRYALPKADGSTNTLTSPQDSGTVNLERAP